MKAKEMNIELITFGEEFVLNSAFYILAQGNRVYADSTTYLGGTEIGEGKYVYGELNKYYTNISYSNHNSYLKSKLSSVPYNPEIKENLEKLYLQFGNEYQEKILESRKKTISNPSEIDLNNIIMAPQAKSLGLIDEIGRVYETIPKLVPEAHCSVIRGSELKRIVTSLKRIEFTS